MPHLTRPNRTLRVLSYNIHKGFAMGNARFRLHEMRECIRRLDADIVFLQEVVGEHRHHHQRIHNWAAQQFEFLADGIWPHHAYGKNAIYDHGHHGNAILSQFPFNTVDNLDVSLLPTSYRGILHGSVHRASGPALHVACLHFGLLTFERRRQTQRLQHIITQHMAQDAPLLIAGDFNDWHGEVHRALTRETDLKEALFERNGKLANTFPARHPLLPMDRIYYRHLTLQHAEVLDGSPWDELSDHCALFAEFTC